MSDAPEKPILFSGEMVRAILEGRKRVTRRVVKLRRPSEVRSCLATSPPGEVLGETFQRNARPLCPYDAPRLWVRETWAHYQTLDARTPGDGRAFTEWSDGLAGYRADGFDTIDEFKRHVLAVRGLDCHDIAVRDERWRPSIHMPRWASRLLLDVKSIRVERLQEITEEDAKAEGVTLVEKRGVGETAWMPCARENFALDWDALNAKRGYGWESNPWAWRIEFSRVQSPSTAIPGGAA